MSLTFEVNRVHYGNLRSASMTASKQSISRQYELVSGSTDNFKDFPIRNGDEIRILVNDQLVLTGFAEKLSFRRTVLERSITIHGRDKTGDIVDSSIVKPVTFEQTTTLKSVIEKLLKNNSIDLNVIQTEGLVIEPFSIVEFVSRKTGKIRDFVSKDLSNFILDLAKRRQVLIRSNENSDLVITREGLDRFPNPIGDVIEAETEYDDTKRFNRYIFHSQASLMVLNAIGSVPPLLLDQIGEAFDKEIRKSRTYVEVDDSNSSKSAKSRAEWESNVRRSTSKQYTVTLKGFENAPGIIWKPNFLVHVTDEFSGIDADLVIRSVNFSMTDSEERTTLNLVAKDSFTLKTEVDSVEGPANPFGDSG